MKNFQIIALTLPGILDPSIAIAASRAGGIGVLDLEYFNNKEVALKSIHKLAKFAHNDFGLKLSAANAGRVAKMLPEWPTHLKFALLTFQGIKALKDAIADLQRRGLSVWVECTHLDQALRAEKSGADGVIAKGHESGGRIGNETAFILVQQFTRKLSLPVWVQGGIGVHSAAACYAAGAAGIIVDAQLALTRESVLPEDIKSKIAGMDGTETQLLGEEIGQIYRVCSRLSLPVIQKLKQKERGLIDAGNAKSKTIATWAKTISRYLGPNAGGHQLYFFGQDIALAVFLADRFVTVGGVLTALEQSVGNHIKAAQLQQSLAEGSPLAQSHGTRFPIVQGPMARVSDNIAFISTVARGGALPFLAAAWMRENELEPLLKETEARLDGMPWGVGLLGFLPPEVYREQIKILLKYRPPFALIAGGQPHQAKMLEQEGIATYLHVPSPGLLRLYLDSGLRRFVFEGRESGGHVGPLCSFVMWEMMIEILLASLNSGKNPEEYHVLFAGGIHDALSAAMVAVMASTLVERGVRVGFQMGSAYLFTDEAVDTEAVVRKYVNEAIQCGYTALLETSAGHTVRCIDNSFAKFFKSEKLRLTQTDLATEKIQSALERIKLGRLRIATKGLVKNPDYDGSPSKSKLVSVSEDEQSSQGLYMIGQLAALRQKTCSIAQLHQSIISDGSKRIEAMVQQDHAASMSNQETAKPSDIAIIGMACLLPNAPNLQQYWENILNKITAIEEIPSDRWDWRRYYSEDRTDADTVYSKWGAFIDPMAFDPIQYGMPPNTLPSIEPLQLLTLEVASEALKDAGYRQRPFPKERTAVILGISGVADLAHSYCFRSALPHYADESPESIVPYFRDKLPQWTEDSFPGILPNVAAGRIANRLDLGGTNFVVDGACASSLAAVYTAVKELETGAADMALVGGADAMQNPFTYLCFSNTQALSPRGQCCPLDESADGIVIGEGIAVAVLKRLADAQRDGDNIYAVIKGVGAASDGRDKSLTAPRPQGQLMALERAYLKSGVSPATVGLIEAHATGTTVGDKAEIEALSRLLDESGAGKNTCAIGSVKSMIGHTKSTAGIASLVKAALSLYHKTLPPTLGVKNPNRALQAPESPLYVNTESRPWIPERAEHPRRAGVSAFGFGGTNFHVVLEENTDSYLDHLKTPSMQAWPSELLIFKAHSRSELLELINSAKNALDSGAKPSLAELAYACARKVDGTKSDGQAPRATLAIVAASLTELSQKIAHFQQLNQNSEAAITDPGGIYFSEKQPLAEGRVAFVFPGQGSQYVNMLADLAINFPEVRERFERSNLILKDKLPAVLSSYVFPKPAFGDQESLLQKQALAQTRVAQPAIGTADLAIFNLLKFFGLSPDMVAGHSYGEYVALCAAGVFAESDLILLSEARARFMAQAAQTDPGAMAAVQADAAMVEKMIGHLDGIWIANINAPEQTVVSGRKPAIEKATEIFAAEGIFSREIPVSCAFHSPLVASARERFADYLADTQMGSPHVKVYSNLTAATYPSDPGLIRDQLAEHLISRVEFVRQIEKMYSDGARIFVEVGPGSVLKGLVDKILRDRPHLALNSNQAGRHDVVQLQHLFGQLVVNGVSVQLHKLFELRSISDINLDKLLVAMPDEKLPPATWWVNGARAIPAHRMSDAHQNGNLASGTRNLVVESGTGMPPTRVKLPGGGSPVAPEQRNELSTDSIKSGQRQENLSNSPSLSNEEISEVLIQHQRLMQQFLETQKNVILNFFNPMPDTGRSANIEASEILGKFNNDLGLPDVTGSPLSQPAGSLSGIQPIESSNDSQNFITPDEDDSADEENLQDRDALTAKLLEIVSERTGYPREMLELDADLEADLGIDSIKRVEILGQFLPFAFGIEQSESPAVSDDLNQSKTLRKIIDYVTTHREIPTGGETEELSTPIEEQSPGAPVDAASLPLPPRFTLTPVEAALPVDPKGLLCKSVIIVTDDGRGIAERLSKTLERQGCSVAVVRHGTLRNHALPNHYNLGDISEQGIADLVQTIRKQQGPIGGIVHLWPLGKIASIQDMEMPAWQEFSQLDVKTLFYLLKFLKSDLIRAVGEGGGFVLSATGLGGNFASSPAEGYRDFFPGSGAVIGLLKTAAVEWPDIRVKTVDLNLAESSSDLAHHLFTEIQVDDDRIEIGYNGSRRTTLSLKEKPLPDDETPVLDIDSDWVILITGGARGITADVSRRLALRYRPTLILAGRASMPNAQESDKTAHLKQPKELKNALIAELKQRGQRVTVAKVEKAYQKLRKEREIRANIAAMRQAGAQVIYHQVDVRDERQFGGFINEIYQTHGRLDGVIHGAGIIEDKLIKDKTWQSFSRVFGTKTESVFILNRFLKPEALKFLVLFSSVAGRFGNRGQGDYTAANEVINKFAHYLCDRWPGRVVSINWGPWATSGMVSPEVQRQFAERGVGLVPPEGGAEIFDYELRYGSKSDVEVVIGDGPWRRPAASKTEDDVTEQELPLLQNPISIHKSNGIFELVKCLDPMQDLYLQDHLLDGNPVLPAAMAIEFMAETAQMAYPHLQISGLKNARVLKGIVLDTNPRHIRLVVNQDEIARPDPDVIEVGVALTDVDNFQKLYYKANIILNRKMPIAAPFEVPSYTNLKMFAPSVEKAYQKWLFHGPQFQTIERIEGISEQGMVATVMTTKPSVALAGDSRGHWLMDPFVLDTGPQLAILWARSYLGMTPLPSVFQAVRIFAPFHLTRAIHCYFQVLPRSRIHSVHADVFFTDDNGQLIGCIQGLETTGSKELNRLAESK